MRCETFQNRYDQREPGRGLDLFMKLHLRGCDACRESAERVDSALKAYRLEGPPAASIEARLEERVMAAVRLMPPPRREVLMRDWFLAGAIIFASIALMPLGEDFNRVKAYFGSSYTLPLSLVLGVGLTAFASLFISGHMEEVESLVKRLSRQS